MAPWLYASEWFRFLPQFACHMALSLLGSLGVKRAQQQRVPYCGVPQKHTTFKARLQKEAIRERESKRRKNAEFAEMGGSGERVNKPGPGPGVQPVLAVATLR